MNKTGERLLTELEGVRLVAYKCGAGVWTIGRGHTKGVKEGDRITREQEQALFEADILEWEAAVKAKLTRPPNENQLAALVLLAFNIGLAGFGKSTVLKGFERYDDAAAARAFGLWNKITDPKTGKKVVSDGLVSRRAREAALFLTPVWETLAMPQAVVPEKPMTESTINRAGLIAGGATTLATVAEVTAKLGDIKASVGNLGDWVIPILLVTTLLAVGYIIYERHNQRREGRA